MLRILMQTFFTYFDVYTSISSRILTEIQTSISIRILTYKQVFCSVLWPNEYFNRVNLNEVRNSWNFLDLFSLISNTENFSWIYLVNEGFEKFRVHLSSRREEILKQFSFEIFQVFLKLENFAKLWLWLLIIIEGRR